MSRLFRRLFARTVPTARRTRAARSASSFRARLLLQALEGRVAPAVFAVSNLNDAGPGSLRQAVLDANATPGADTITFDGTLFATPRTISLTSGDLTVTDAVTISGPGAGLLTVRRDQAAATSFRIFTFAGATPFIATLSAMTISGGQATNAAATGGTSGGGVFVGGGGLVVQDVVVGGNTAAADGGGIAATAANLTLRNSTVTSNAAGANPAASRRAGGGVSLVGGSLLLENSTISGNSAATDGGGIYLGGTSAESWTVRNGTIANNTAGASGGGILMRNAVSGAASLTVQSSTIAANTANGSAAGQGGGGIARAGNGGSVSITSTIVANNVSTPAPDVLGAVTANFSLIRNQTGVTITGGNNLPAGTDPVLGTLANNGGPTNTIALSPTSPAVNAGSNPAGLSTEQRVIYPRVVGSAPDIGAYEVQPSAVAGVSNVTAIGGTSYTFTVTYTDPTAISVGTLGSNNIRVTGPNGYDTLATFVGVDNNTNGTPRKATYRIVPPGGSWDAADTGTYTLTLQSGQVMDTSGAPVPAGFVGAFQALIPLTLVVTSAADSGPGTLRDAITQANGSGSIDTIQFGPAFATPHTISLLSALPNIINPVTISGPGAGLLTVRRDPVATTNFRIFTMTAANSTLSGMTITGGLTTGTALNSNGGGGIRVDGANVTVQDSVVTGNSASGPGGGIYVFFGTVGLTVRNCTISDNTAGTDAGSQFRDGGGISIGFGGSLLVESSTVSGNTSPTEGGGIYVYRNSSATWIVRNSTISGNTAAMGGGGIFVRSPDTGGAGALVVQNTTIANNSAGAGLGGGGIGQIGTGGSVTIASTIVANNSSAQAADVLGTIAANFSLVRNQSGASITGANNLSAGTDPLLGPLANNGGPTATLALLPGSPAINAGNNPAGLTTDQRGPGSPRVFGPLADMGAFESPMAVQSVVVNAGQANQTQRSMVTSVTVTFDSVVTFAGPITNAFRLTGTGAANSGDVALTADLSGSTASQTVVTLTFSGPLTEGPGGPRSLVDGNYVLTVFSNQIIGGLPGGDYGSTLFRLYGDVNGDKAVNGLDLAAFRSAFGSGIGNPNYVAYLDANGDGAINGLDLAAFRARFGTSLP
jgi:hypothetical protein